jgi:alkanesulfonate monooxygenase SsuD/methylene tetrahydromethanopterin reductase-like flavin-dependent oxidoreductase (luciferase family)
VGPAAELPLPATSTAESAGAEIFPVQILRCADQADRAGLDLFTLADHPYFASRLDAYATLGAVLGRTSQITGAVTVTNLPSRPAPVLARTVTSLSALSGGRVVLGIGAGARTAGLDRLGRAEVPGRDRTARRRMGCPARRGLAEPGLPRIAAPDRQGGRVRRPGSRGDQDDLQLRRPHHR